MFCENCGKQLDNGVKFCDSCGTKTEAPVNNAQPAQSIQSNPGFSTPPPPPPPSPPQQPAFNQPYQKQNFQQQSFAPQDNTRPLSVGQWIVTFILLIIPIVNIIMIFVWAFGSGKNVNQKNFARAYLILAVIMIAVSIVFSGSIIAIMSSMMGGAGGF